MRILFLDDDSNRAAKFKAHNGANGLHEVVYVDTPQQAFEALERRSRFDIVSLDHDLFGKIYQPSDEKSGFAVCQFLHKLDPKTLPKIVICHSYNEDGVRNMMADITTLPCEQYGAFFDSPDYWGLFISQETEVAA